MTVRTAVFVSLVATIPLLMSPFRESLWKLLFRQQLQVRLGPELVYGDGLRQLLLGHPATCSILL